MFFSKNHFNSKEPWWKIYESLNLFGGELKSICDDDEDMLEITYEDGMMIDVGMYSYKNCYCITVVSSNSTDGWRNPLAKIDVHNKKDLFNKIQDTIIKFRTQKARE